MKPRESKVGKDGVERYRCSLCKAWMGRESFHVNRTMAAGIRSACKACTRFSPIDKKGGAW